MRDACRVLAGSALIVLLIAGCGGNSERSQRSAELRVNIQAESDGGGLQAFTMPDDGDYDSIPQDPNNPITAEKVALGKMLYHETSVSTAGLSVIRNGEWSCAACHHIGAGFKAGIPQGIAEGGQDFGLAGEERVLEAGFVAGSSDNAKNPDVQGIASPAVLNIAYQDVMLWNGALGKAAGSMNSDVAGVDDVGPLNTFANAFGLSGIETQAIAGTRVHRLNFDDINTAGHIYKTRYDAAFSGNEGTIPAGSTVTATALGAAKAIAAYERTIVASLAPFQQWLKGSESAMTLQQIKGALLFFGKAGCVDCHKGPALSSEVGATSDQVFFNVGFSDFDFDGDARIHGSTATNGDFSDGRGGFTGDSDDDFKFKIPQLYNLTDTDVFGHGASFNSVRGVIEYKNAGVPQDNSVDRTRTIDSRFVPLGLSDEEMTQLTDFIENGLYDHQLDRHVPDDVVSGSCFPVADAIAKVDLQQDHPGCL